MLMTIIYVKDLLFSLSPDHFADCLATPPICALNLTVFLSRQYPLTFPDITRSFVKVFVMMIGEFEFVSMFNDEKIHPPPITWLFFFLFLIIMTILLMNVMVSEDFQHDTNNSYSTLIIR